MRRGTGGPEGLTVFNPYLGNLLFGNQYFIGAANTKNAEDATTIEGSKSCFKGIIVSTNGRTQLAGEQNSFTCPVMGDRVRLNGSKLYISNECLQAPNLQIDKTPDGQVTVNAGDNAEFTITVTNSSGPASNVDVEDVLPGTGWSIVTKTFSGNNLPQGADDCAISGGNTLHCDIATFGTGQTLVVVVRRATTTADCAGSATAVRLDNGSITGGPAEVEVNDVDADTDPGHLFVRCPDVTVSKTPDESVPPGPANDINAGTNATFTITFTNLGPGQATGVGTLPPHDALPGTGWFESGGDTDNKLHGRCERAAVFWDHSRGATRCRQHVLGERQQADVGDNRLRNVAAEHRHHHSGRRHRGIGH